MTADVAQGLEWLNALSAAAATAELLTCCGAPRWAEQMTQRRPFADWAELARTADEVWWSLAAADWHAAFAQHPRIGERKAAQPQAAQAKHWSAQEQAGAQGAAQATHAQLSAANQAYEQKFGHIFIVCATGLTAAEMLTRLRARLPNDPGSELHNAAAEQSKITRLRLEKLLTR